VVPERELEGEKARKGGQSRREGGERRKGGGRDEPNEREVTRVVVVLLELSFFAFLHLLADSLRRRFALRHDGGKGRGGRVERGWEENEKGRAFEFGASTHRKSASCSSLFVVRCEKLRRRVCIYIT